jgi:hypothetical protein
VDLFGLAVTAAGQLYLAVQAGTLADYTDAAADATLWSEVQCAIFTSIMGAGQVTDGNFASMVTAVRAVSYAHGDVVTAIGDYLEHMGAAAVEAAQLKGGLYVGDCSSCTWCHTWNFLVSDGGWLSHTGNETWTAGLGWQGAWDGGSGKNLCEIEIGCNGVYVAHLEVAGIAGQTTTQGNDRKAEDYSTVFWHFTPDVTETFYPAGAFDESHDVNHTIDTGVIVCNDHRDSTAPTGSISSITMSGTGVSPFGADNC